MLKKTNVEFTEGDISDLKQITDAMKDVDYCLHQAAIPSVPKSVENPELTNKANIDGTLNVLIAAKNNNVKRVVYAASSSAYGNSAKLPKIETMTPNPLSPYAIQKLTGEYYCKVFYEIYGLETISLRYFNVFGERQDPNSEYSAVIPKFITAILNNKNPIIFGDGSQSRDFTYIKNVVDANILAVKAKKTHGEIINIAMEKRITLVELVESINKILGKSIKPVFADERQGDVKHSLAGIKKAKEILGYAPKYSFEYGLKKTIDFYKNIN